MKFGHPATGVRFFVNFDYSYNSHKTSIMILDLISIIVSGFAIIISSYFAQIANRMNKKVNEKDYEISEQLKYDLLKLVATLRFYDSKAALSHLT